uniref:receptor protein serine/threonine kinase n=1 Tax=Myripristis murdjan TaxID=586833 RepID=A0A668APE5_9TELE
RRWRLIGHAAQTEERECAFADRQWAELQDGPANEHRGTVWENATVRCTHGSRCYGLWEKSQDGEIHLVKQGCWTHIGDQQECLGDRCLVTATPSQIQNGSYRFCCCSRDLCNVNFTEAPPTEPTAALNPQPLPREETLLIVLVTVTIAAILVVGLFLGYRMLTGNQKQGLSSLDVMEAASSEPAVDLDNLKLLELIGRGRYGSVYRGCLNERCVAVKLFSSANRHNYANERAIYRLPLLRQHDNIARFLAADERMTADGRSEYLIVMEYYPHGCLSRYLSLHTADWLTCCRMTHSLTRGLAFLHTELCRGDQYKAAVCHRDVSSRNVLVRADLSCVLADFGLSMKLTGSRLARPGDDDSMAISEVGTVRYMAPEVLGGAVNLRDCESALKQVDMYAVGLIYWETFMRCSDLFPGEAVPDYQLAFQAETGNHPSFEEMQILVAREKQRPRFPDAWKENSLAVRSLKETMEDCWDQDAEARLTAQCAEERLADLSLLSPAAGSTAIHNQRNLSSGRWPPPVGSSSFIEDLQVGGVKNLQGDGHLATVITTTATGRAGGATAVAEKNRNYERQQAQVASQARSSSSDGSVSVSASSPGTVLSTVSESEHTGVSCTHTHTHTHTHRHTVDKNLRESSDENLMEHSQKQFSSDPQNPNLLFHLRPPSTEVNGSVAAQTEQGGAGGAEPPALATIHPPPPLPKQQNLPQRPTSLHLQPKIKESASAASRLKFGKLKSNNRQVETGVAKMNTVTVAVAEPHLVTTVTNNTGTTGGIAVGNSVPVTVIANGYSAGVPTLVTNGMMGGGRTNLAGPQVEEEEKMEGGMSGGEDSRLNLLNSSPDEHEPLLSREQPPAERDHLPHHHHHHHHHQSRAGSILSGRGSNSNNNNNRLTQGSEVKAPAAPEAPEAPAVPEASVPGGALEPQMRQNKPRRPERPCSLDLSSSCTSSADVSLSEDSRSLSGEKIKRRVKTPYALKKWRPATWVVSMDTSLDIDLDTNSGSGGHTHFSSNHQKPGSVSIPKINQSKSSMAVFLVGGGATATMTSDPRGVTCL